MSVTFQQTFLTLAINGDHFIMRLTKQTLLLLSFFFLSQAAIAQTSGEHSFNSDGVEVHYQLMGEGEPVILIHGYMSSFDHNWQYTTPVLKEEFRLIGMDIRGHGYSGKPQKGEAYGDELYLDVKRLMKHLDIKKAHLVGYSLGGYIALKFAVEFPHKVSSVVMAGSGLLKKEEIEHIANSLSSGLKSSESITAFYKSRYPSDALTDAFFEQVSSNDKVAMTRLIKKLPALYVSPEEVEKITGPILAVSGEYDRALENVAYLTKFAPHTNVVKIEGRHHLNAPKDSSFTAAIKNFITKVEEKYSTR